MADAAEVTVGEVEGERLAAREDLRAEEEVEEAPGGHEEEQLDGAGEAPGESAIDMGAPAAETVD